MVSLTGFCFLCLFVYLFIYLFEFLKNLSAAKIPSQSPVCSRDISRAFPAGSAHLISCVVVNRFPSPYSKASSRILGTFVPSPAT